MVQEWMNHEDAAEARSPRKRVFANVDNREFVQEKRGGKEGRDWKGRSTKGSHPPNTSSGRDQAAETHRD